MHRGARLLWLKNGAQGRLSCMACSSKKTVGLMSQDASTFVQGLPVPFKVQAGRESLPLCIGNTCEFDNWDGHATVLHGDGVEFGA